MRNDCCICFFLKNSPEIKSESVLNTESENTSFACICSPNSGSFYTNIFDRKFLKKQSLKIQKSFRDKFDLGKDSWKSYKNKIKGSNLFFNEHIIPFRHFGLFTRNKFNIYMCSKCFAIFQDILTSEIHRIDCDVDYPPGECVYKEAQMLVFKVKGISAKSYCRKLCLLGLCFLKHKTLYQDIELFEFFVLLDNKKFIGYFSRQVDLPKVNLSCILVLPKYQKQGYGYFLIDLSYKLQKRGCRGTPEGPLSKLGAQAYNKYWKTTIYYTLIMINKKASIKDISKISGMNVNDVIYAMDLLGILKRNSKVIDFRVPNLEMSVSRFCKKSCILPQT